MTSILHCIMIPSQAVRVRLSVLGQYQNLNTPRHQNRNTPESESASDPK